MNRDFKIIEGFSNYVVFRSGEVMNWTTGRLRKPFINKGGYAWVGLHKDGVQKKFYIHRLVAIAFIPNPENKPEVNHKDGNKLNNNDWNLQWTTTKENVEHSITNQLRKKAFSKRVVKLLNTISIKYNIPLEELLPLF